MSTNKPKTASKRIYNSHAKKHPVALHRDSNLDSNKKPGQVTDNFEKAENKAGNLPLDANICPIVGIGASAGGLDAFTQLFKNLPSSTGMAFVLVQHLDPLHKSMLTEILSKVTLMPVTEIQGSIAVKPDHVYIIPPNKSLVIFHGVLNLLPREELTQIPLPIDYFLNSLAEDQGNKAIGVILSGNASDGTLGLRAIKAAGGITFAQSPESAQYDSMPRHAIAAGDVDFTLPPSEIAGELVRLGQNPYYLTAKIPKNDDEFLYDQDNLNRIFSLLRIGTGADFSYYKPTTLKRRIVRRMILHNIEQIAGYVKYLQHNPVEIKALAQDILIGVTSFFREPETFEQLKAEVFPNLLRSKTDDTPVRIWVPGCSTGEEAYSIAIALIEFFEEQGIHYPIQVFATDLNDSAVKKARSGIYPESIQQDVAPERLRRFFVKANSNYQICKSVRDLCIFAEQNIIKDPPFSGLDLISCRNVLIYFGPLLQRKVIPIFHYALKPNGYLMLGTSESIGTFLDLFTLVDKKYKVYLKKAIRTPLNFDFTIASSGATKLEDDEGMKTIHADYDVLKEADQILLTQYAPASILVNDKLEILQFRGQIDPYLSHAPGLASFNLFKMTQPDLAIELHKAIHQADKEACPFRKEGLQIDGQNLNIEVFPLKDPAQEKNCFLIVFEAATSFIAGKNRPQQQEPEQTSQSDEVYQLEQLKKELAATIEYQQSIIEQREAANEELRAANEEIQSSNEELQSTHEEMETAKEELQATNEELITVNDEIRNRNAELNQVNNDLNNLLSSTNIPIIILGNDMRIRRFTVMAEKVMNLIPSDVGRPFSDIRPNIELPHLEEMIQEVIDTLMIKEQEVQDRLGRWYSLCIRPYKTFENRIDGVVITVFDINTIKPSLEQLQEARDYIAILETIREPFVILDAGFRVKLANQAFCRTFQVVPSETENQVIFDLGNGEWNIPLLRALLEDILPKNSSFHDFKVEYHFPKIGHRIMLLNARSVVGEGNLTPFILLAFEDMTEKWNIGNEK